MEKTKADKLEAHFKEILRIRDERESCRDKQVEHYQKFKKFLGRVQELSRNLNEKIEEGRKLVQ